MYFDDVVDKNKDICVNSFDGTALFLKDAIPFRFSDDLFMEAINYWQGREDMPEFEKKYARTPYKSIFMHFGGTRGYWVMGQEVKDSNLYSLMIFCFDKAAGNLCKSLPEPSIDMEFYEDIPKEKETIENIITHGLYYRMISAQYLHDENIFKVNTICGQSVDNSTEMKEPLLSYLWIFQIVARTLTLLNCTNIKHEKHTADRKIQNKRERKRKLPISSYYTLQIDSFKNQPKKLPDKEKQDHNRIHLCRGHFKEYTEQNKLFGKYTGLWWWGPQARGRKEKGVIHKNYEVVG